VSVQPLPAVWLQVDVAAHSSMSTHVALAPLPLAAKPAPHVQVKPPGVFAQPFTLPPPSVRPHCAGIAHSFTSTHVALNPLPLATKPAPHAHM
jgi:hypothetical protein